MRSASRSLRSCSRKEPRRPARAISIPTLRMQLQPVFHCSLGGKSRRYAMVPAFGMDILPQTLSTGNGQVPGWSCVISVGYPARARALIYACSWYGGFKMRARAPQYHGSITIKTRTRFESALVRGVLRYFNRQKRTLRACCLRPAKCRCWVLRNARAGYHY